MTFDEFLNFAKVGLVVAGLYLVYRFVNRVRQGLREAVKPVAKAVDWIDSKLPEETQKRGGITKAADPVNSIVWSVKEINSGEAKEKWEKIGNSIETGAKSVINTVEKKPLKAIEKVAGLPGVSSLPGILKKPAHAFTHDLGKAAKSVKHVTHLFH